MWLSITHTLSWDESLVHICYFNFYPWIREIKSRGSETSPCDAGSSHSTTLLSSSRQYLSLLHPSAAAGANSLPAPTAGLNWGLPQQDLAVRGAGLPVPAEQPSLGSSCGALPLGMLTLRASLAFTSLHQGAANQAPWLLEYSPSLSLFTSDV